MDKNKMENKNIYCGICKIVTEHKYKGTQQGIPGKTLELYDCVQCQDTCGRWNNLEIQYFDIPDNSKLAGQFRENHYHLWRWLNSGLGKKYLKGLEFLVKRKKAHNADKNEDEDVLGIGAVVNIQEDLKGGN